MMDPYKHQQSHFEPQGHQHHHLPHHQQQQRTPNQSSQGNRYNNQPGRNITPNQPRSIPPQNYQQPQRQHHHQQPQHHHQQPQHRQQQNPDHRAPPVGQGRMAPIGNHGHHYGTMNNQHLQPKYGHHQHQDQHPQRQVQQQQPRQHQPQVQRPQRQPSPTDLHNQQQLSQSRHQHHQQKHHSSRNRQPQPQAEKPQNPYSSSDVPPSTSLYEKPMNNYQPMSSQDVTNQRSINNEFHEETYEEFKARRRRDREERALRYGTSNNFNSEDLNAIPNDPDDLNNTGASNYESAPKEKQMSAMYSDEEEEEDEQLEDIKSELRFTRDKTIESTERTLEMARRAEESGQNTMTMLGSQSAKLFTTEKNLQLSETSTKLGGELAKELSTAGNVFKAPSNPFNKKRQLRRKEEKQRLQIVEDQQRKEQTLQEFQESERRVLQNSGESRNPYRQNDYPAYKGTTEEQYKQYTYEGEGEYAKEQEYKINRNLHDIQNYASKLKKLAYAQREEVDRQEVRLNQMSENVNRVQIGVEVNTERLRRITGK